MASPLKSASLTPFGSSTRPKDISLYMPPVDPTLRYWYSSGYLAMLFKTSRNSHVTAAESIQKELQKVERCAFDIFRSTLSFPMTTFR